VRRFFSIAAIAFAALGLLWLLRLANRSAQASSTPDQGPSGNDLPPSIVAESERVTEKPAPTLGRTGGKLPDTLIDPRLLAEKSRRTLTVFSEGRPVKTYRIALGTDPVPPKEREADGRTPEGRFFICMKNSQSRYHLSLGLSYPSELDAERGIEQNLISKREQRLIDEAIRHYRRPPWNTKLGGEIMIHGGGAETDWTTGCLALSDTDIGELFPRLPLGTEVEIRP
jgi:hypothetical protein